jgi:hypothetical protein
MPPFDYNVPAELFLAKPMKGSRTKYRRFATAAEAIRYAVEDLRTPRAFGAWLQVGDERFNSVEIQRLYEDGEYPLRKSLSARGLPKRVPFTVKAQDFAPRPVGSKKG